MSSETTPLELVAGQWLTPTIYVADVRGGRATIIVKAGRTTEEVERQGRELRTARRAAGKSRVRRRRVN